ncbi:hypothetical protein Csa_016734 [Cucumis sativus]|uniref:Uncharacterized protein n=1 Tax=Cucumis sativus TaxID=3659 RepID=A0A0A0K9K3_CUCSA|nr:hypothetical protein Csa_016734 [Cucumis sativus]
MSSLLMLLKALMGGYGDDEDLEGNGGEFERKVDGLSEFEFLSLGGGGDEDGEELKKIWKLLGENCLWP